MNRFKMFMMGRYGSDQLSIAIIISGMLLTFLGDAFSSIIPTLLSYVVFGLCIFRIMSKNISARRQENYKFLKIWNPIGNLFKKNFITYKNMYADRKSYKYFKCPNCKQMLRVPKGRGKIAITCTKCGTKFNKQT